MRVLFLEPSAQVTGGAIALLRVVEAMDRRTFRPLVVLGSTGPLVSRFRRIPGCRVLCLPFPPGLSAVTRAGVLSGGVANLRTAIRYGARLRVIANRWQADVVHSNGMKMHLLSSITRRQGRLLVWHIRDVVGAPYMPERSAAIVRALVRRVPNAAICISQATWAPLRRRSGRSLRTPAVVRDGVRCPPIMSPPTVRSERGCVLMLGRIAAWKGQAVFVRAAQRLCTTDSDTRFVIAGGATTAEDAAYERRLRAQIVGAGLSNRIELVGVVTDVEALLSAADVMVHCSTSPEPFGLVIIEAMAAGVPVVATALGGPAEIISDRRNGYLYPPGDDARLAEILSELMRDTALRHHLARAGRATVEADFAIERTVEAITAIYRRGVDDEGTLWNGAAMRSGC